MNAEPEWLPDPKIITVRFNRPRRTWAMRAIEHSYATEGTLMMLLIMCEFATKRGIVHLSVPELAKHCRMSDRQVQRNLRKLIEWGEVGVERQGDGRGKKTIYRLKVGA